MERLNLSGFRISTIEDAPDAAARLDIASLDGSPAYALLWDQPDPRTKILLSVLPLGVALVCAITALLAVMLRRYRLALHELADSEERNRRMANHDALTGLANRAQFDARLDQLVAKPPREGFAVMCIDLDKFKAVNDTYGHNAGDAVLVAAASRFAERVGDKGLVARTGGDEFVALVTSGIDPLVLKMLGECLIADAERAGRVRWGGPADRRLDRRLDMAGARPEGQGHHQRGRPGALQFQAGGAPGVARSPNCRRQKQS